MTFEKNISGLIVLAVVLLVVGVFAVDRGLEAINLAREAEYAEVEKMQQFVDGCVYYETTLINRGDAMSKGDTLQADETLQSLVDSLTTLRETIRQRSLSLADVKAEVLQAEVDRLRALLGGQ